MFIRYDMSFCVFYVYFYCFMCIFTVLCVFLLFLCVFLLFYVYFYCFMCILCVFESEMMIFKVFEISTGHFWGSLFRSLISFKEVRAMFPFPILRHVQEVSKVTIFKVILVVFGGFWVFSMC